MKIFKSSIRNKLTRNFLMLIIITVIILQLVLITGIRTYFYKALEDVLSNQIMASLGYLSGYLRYSNLEEIIIDDVEIFWRNTDGQIQVFNKDGDIILDSLGTMTNYDKKPLDVQSAFKDEKGMLIQKEESLKEKVMSVSMPIKNKNEIEGVLRFSTSMEEVDDIIKFLSLLLTVASLIVIAIASFVSYYMANAFVKPLQNITATAEEMALGDLDVRSLVNSEDEIGKLAETLNYMASELQQQEKLKNDFISSISHELKTPLTSIKGWAITLQDVLDGEDELTNEGLEIIENESDRLSRMLEELLDFNRYMKEEHRFAMKNVNVQSFLTDIYRQMYPRAVLNQVKIKLILEEVNFEIPMIKNRMRQVFINLLDNGIKFSKPDSSLTFKAKREENTLIIEVIDEGIGISPEDLPYVKDKFFKGNSEFSTSGIGLSISDEIVKLHNGELIIESEENIGTIARVILTIGDIDE